MSDTTRLKMVICDTDPALAASVRQVAPALDAVFAADEAAARRAIADADAFYGVITPDLLAAAPRLRWVQNPTISLEKVVFPDLVPHPVVVTNMRGVLSDVIADQVLGYIVYFARAFHVHVRNQPRRHWAAESEYRVTPLQQATLGIVGLGGIGTEVMRRAAACGMRIVAVDARRTDRPPEVAALWPPERLPDLLAQSDFVAICAPETPATRGLFGRTTLQAMKPGAYLINVGRGKIVQLDALVEALHTGRLAGAALDVFETEPLPADHPLWAMENVLITPHMASVGAPWDERRHAVLLDNIRRFVNGEPLQNVVDKAQWF